MANPAFASIIRNAVARLTTGNTGTAATSSNTNIVDVVTAGTNGSRIDDISLQAETTVTDGMLRLWIHDGTTNYLLMEIQVVATTPSGTEKAWTSKLTNLGICLQTGWKLKASTHNSENFVIAITQMGDY